MIRPFFLMIFLILFGCTSVTAQLQDNTIVISGNIVLPAGGWEDFFYPTNTGFGVGADYLVPLSESGLALVSTAGLLINRMNASRYSYIYSYYSDTAFLSLTGHLEDGYWINIPVMSGLGLSREITSNVEFLGVIQLGFDMIFAPDIKYIMPPRERRDKLDNAIAFGYAFGGNLLIDGKASISLRYYGFGEPTFTYERYFIDEIQYDNAKLPVSFLNIQIGYCF